MNENEARMNALRQLLANTDYKAIKYSEGAISDAEYAETKAQRKEWREEINKLEAEISEEVVVDTPYEIA